MAETDGKWIGNKNGSNYFIDFIYKKQVKFPKAGIYQFEIIQGMRDTELKGIGSIGFEISGSR
jgi:gliding motility-associated lipoprotein GldH